MVISIILFMMHNISYKVYTNKPEGVHAEILFIRDNQSSSQITALWLKDSPCRHCSERLITHFKYNSKPKIFIGTIPSNTEGITALNKEGFKICSWETFDNLMKGNNSCLSHYLKTITD